MSDKDERHLLRECLRLERQRAALLAINSRLQAESERLRDEQKSLEASVDTLRVDRQLLISGILDDIERCQAEESLRAYR